MNRITVKDLEQVVRFINKETGNPETSYTREGNKSKANIGNYHLDGAYGGYSLHQMMNEGGGIHETFRCGHIPKRELYDRMNAFLDGLEVKKA